MNIVAVGDIPFPFGSAGASRMRNVLRGLKGLGHEVQFISFAVIPHRSQDIVNNGRYYLGVNYESVIGYGDQYTKKNPLWTRPIWYKQIAESTWRGYQRVKLIFEEGRADVVLIYSRNAASFEPIINLARDFGVPVFSDVVEWPTAHSFRGGILNPFFWNTLWMLHFTNRKANGITAISSYIVEKYRIKGLPVLRIPALVEPDLFLHGSISVNDKFGDPNIFDLFYLGSLSEKDDPGTLLEVLKVLVSSGKSINLHVVGTNGKSGNAQRFSQTCERGNLSHLIRFHGRVSDLKLKEILMTADAFILPRNEKQDELAAFPTRLPELLLTGKPVVTVKVGDIQEYLIDGLHAMVCNPGDVDEISKRIKKLIDNPSLCNKIGNLGMQQAIEVFSYKHHAPRIEKFILEAS